MVHSLFYIWHFSHLDSVFLLFARSKSLSKLNSCSLMRRFTNFNLLRSLKLGGGSEKCKYLIFACANFNLLRSLKLGGGSEMLK